MEPSFALRRGPAPLMANKTETLTAVPEETDSWAADLGPPHPAAQFELSLKPQQHPCYFAKFQLGYVIKSAVFRNRHILFCQRGQC